MIEGIREKIKLFKSSDAFIPWAILLVLSMIWGSSFILMKRGLESFSFQQVAALRIFIAFLVLLPFVIKHLFKIPRKYWLTMTIAGYLGNGLPPFLFTKAQTYLSSSVAGILNALTPLFTFILGILFFQVKARWYKFLGVTLGLAGSIGLLLSGGDNQWDNLGYGFYIILATLCYAMGTNIVKRYLSDIKPLHLTGFFFLVTGLPLGFYIFTTDFIDVLLSDPQAIKSLGFISLLAIFGSAISLVLWNTLIKKTSAVFASSVTYIMPIFAIMWGVLDGESFLPVYFFMIALIVIGIYLTNRK
ncbi:MAG: DMT family transporter [Bacteroidales bacterium]|nr:DMT family transporter [Bacteroidales bacterium]